MKKQNAPEVLPRADAEADCLPDPVLDHEEEEDHELNWAAVEEGETAVSPSLAHWQRQRAHWSRLLERFALVIEKPVNQLVGNRELNPFYHTGQIALFLLLVVTLTGFYLFLFFQYGFDASYLAVERIETQFIARTMRAIHRYASGALVITALLHAFRTLFLEQFHGPRWLPWVTGVIMTGFIWLAGVTGYWLLWDGRSQLITERAVAFLQRFSNLGANFRLYLLRVSGGEDSWPVLLSIMGFHILLTLLVGLFFWIHLRRLSRPRWLPDPHWVIGMGLVLLLGALLFPAGTLPQASFDALAGPVTFDPIFLFFLPLGPGGAALVWGGLLLTGLVALGLPWLRKRPLPPTVHILHDRCTGCTKCALDCPYDAIQMVERHDGKPHKYIAIANRDLCVSCGICVGSCDGLAVALGSDPPEIMWQTISGQMALARAKAPDEPLRLIFACERHTEQGALAQMAGAACVVTLPCAGAAPPDLMTRALKEGTAAVTVVGCSPNDCLNREGNVWAAQRLLRERIPRLKKAYADAPITAVWVAPNEVDEAALALPAGNGATDYRARRRLSQPVTWRNLLVGFGLLALVLGLQIWATQWPLLAHEGETAVVQLLLSDIGEPLGANRERLAADEVVYLRLWANGRLLHEVPFTSAEVVAGRPYLYELPLEPGTYPFALRLEAAGRRAAYTLVEGETAVGPRQIIRLSYEPEPGGFCFGLHCAE